MISADSKWGIPRWAQQITWVDLLLHLQYIMCHLHAYQDSKNARIDINISVAKVTRLSMNFIVWNCWVVTAFVTCLLRFYPFHPGFLHWHWGNRTSLALTSVFCEDINTLRPGQNGRHFADILKYIFLNETVWISIKMSLKFVPKGIINNIPALVQIMALRRPSDKPVSEPIMARLPTHISVTRSQSVNSVHVSE